MWSTLTKEEMEWTAEVAVEQEFGPRHKKNKEEETEKEKNRKSCVNKRKIFLPYIKVEWTALLVCIWEVLA